MKRFLSLFSIFVATAALIGCAQMGMSDSGWVTLLDGSNPSTLANWNRLGDANWRVEDGAVVAD